ncbi:ankyrin repeat domain-containing protein [Spirosoma harenae]
MKFITTINWVTIAIGILLLAYVLLTKKSLGSDPAGRGMEQAFALFGLILLVILLLANFLPIPWVRVAIFILLCLPAVGAISQLISSATSSLTTKNLKQDQYTGAYYFTDPIRRELAKAIASRDSNQVKTLLQSPIPNLNNPGTDGVTLLDFTAMGAISAADEQATISCLSLLMDKGVTLESSDPNHTPTHVLICRGSTTGLLEWLLKKKANPNAPDPTAENAPMLFSTMTAYNGDRAEKIRLLIDAGADPNSRFPASARSWLAGHTALQAAARQEFWDVCQVLLDKGADPSLIGPQHFVFTDFVAHQVNLNTQPGNQSEAFDSMQKTLAKVLAKSNSK